MIQLVRPTEAMKEQAIEFRQEFFEGGSPCAGKSSVARYMQTGARKGYSVCRKVTSMNAEQVWMREPLVQWNFIILHGQRILLQRRLHYPVDWRISIWSRRQTSAAEKLMNWRFIKRICNVQELNYGWAYAIIQTINSFGKRCFDERIHNKSGT